MKRTRYAKTVACVAALALTLGWLSFFPAPAAAQADDPSDGIELRPGLLIHPTLDVAYVMTPEGVAAVDTKTGNKQWTSSAAAKPLTLVRNLLISQAKTGLALNRLELLGLDTQGRGSTSLRGVADLPAGVKVSIGETPEGTFELAARPAGNAVAFRWEFEPVALHGRDNEREKVTARPAPGRDQIQPARENLMLRQPQSETPNAGALSMNLSTGAVTRRQDSVAESAALLASIEQTPQRVLFASEKMAAAPPAATQYVSADGRHVMASERVGDERVWDKYRWTVYERATGRRLGEFRTHLSFNPFVVRDSLVIFETTPFVRRGEQPEPAKLRAYSLATGREAWSVEVREIVYRGPYPP